MKHVSATPRARASGTTRRAPRLAAAWAALVASGCWSTHEWPEPMDGYHPSPEELERGPGGPLEVTVLRHADPVQVRRSDSAGAFPLRFFAKRERVKSGGVMLVGAGGRGETLWGEAGTSAVLFDDGALLVGEPGRGEPTMTLLAISRGRFRLSPSDRLRLMGGAELTTATNILVGPFVVERIRPDLLRVRNQTKHPARIAYREEVIRLGSGQLVDLPLLPDGVAPEPVDPDFSALSTDGMALEAKGSYESAAVAGGLAVRGTGPSVVRGRGVRIETEAGDVATFLPLVTPPD